MNIKYHDDHLELMINMNTLQKSVKHDYDLSSKNENNKIRRKLIQDLDAHHFGFIIVKYIIFTYR